MDGSRVRIFGKNQITDSGCCFAILFVIDSESSRTGAADHKQISERIKKMKKNSVKPIILAAAAALIVLFFLPVYSIPGLKMIGDSDGISSLTQMLGIEMEVMGIEATIIEGQFLVALKLLLPAAVLLLWLVFKPKKTAMISLILGAADFVFCLLSYSMLKSGLNNYEPNRTVLFYLELILALAIAVLSFIANGSSVDVAAAGSKLGKMAGSAAQAGRQFASSFNEASASARIERKCPSCGAVIPEGSNFCGQCGTQYVPAAYLVCAKCGNILEEDDVFCPVCGTKCEKTEDRVCVNCGKTFSRDNDFCPYCGTKYADPEKRVCRSCGAELPIGTDFCGRCGTRYE